MEITTRTQHGRFLLKPGKAMNETFVGVVAKALQHHDIRLHAIVVMSSHYHLILSPANVAELSGFMRFVNGQLSYEVGKLHDWSGSLWHRRFTSIPISDEEAAQVDRLEYILRNSCKEGLVLSPRDWPGVHCAAALADGEPLHGVWVDRQGFHEARKRGEDVKLADFEEQLEIHLEPLPCWRHLDDGTWRRNVGDLVEKVEKETLEMHRREGTVPRGASAVLRTHPHQTTPLSKRSPRPRIHAFAKEVRRRMMEAWSCWVRAYSEAAERLRDGLPKPCFPPDCHPPPLPHVPPLPAT